MTIHLGGPVSKITDDTLNVLMYPSRESKTDRDERLAKMPAGLSRDKDGKLRINHLSAANRMRVGKQLVFYHGRFLSPTGAISRKSLARELSETLIKEGWTGRADNHVNQILASLEHLSARENISVNEATIPLANGDLDISSRPWKLHGGKTIAPYRLLVKYVQEDAPMPNFEKMA